MHTVLMILGTLFAFATVPFATGLGLLGFWIFGFWGALVGVLLGLGCNLASNKSSGRRHLTLLRGLVLCGLLSASGLVSADLQRGLKNFEDLMAGRKRVEQLSATELQEVMTVLKAAERQGGGTGGSRPSYPIEVSHNDELFIINGEKFEARSYCFNMNEGDAVIFLDGSPHGVCTSATLLNLRTRDTCKVWCE